VGAHHVAHETADAALFILDDQPVWPHLQRFSDTGIHGGRLLAVPAQPDIRPLGALKHADVGDIFG